jgi:hypothetical protein
MHGLDASDQPGSTMKGIESHHRPGSPLGLDPVASTRSAAPPQRRIVMPSCAISITAVPASAGGGVTATNANDDDVDAGDDAVFALLRFWPFRRRLYWTLPDRWPRST